MNSKDLGHGLPPQRYDKVWEKVLKGWKRLSCPDNGEDHESICDVIVAPSTFELCRVRFSGVDAGRLEFLPR